MKNVLLIEPNYKNKFPPLGLMKISTYHKNKKDRVRFYKGISDNLDKSYDIIYITSLFTFEYIKTVKTVRFYVNKYKEAKIFLGGISASILKDKYLKDLPKRVIVFSGILNDSTLLDNNSESVDIDALIPDYDILDDINYEYKENDSYFVHTSRGCIRKCSFCAVPTLEPNFYYKNNVKEIISKIDELYGVKKTLHIMDNNVIYLEEFNNIVKDLIDIGFGKNNKIKKEHYIDVLFKGLHRRYNQNQDTYFSLKKIYIYLRNIFDKYSNKEFRYLKKQLIFNNFTIFLNDLEKNNLNYDFYINNEEIIKSFSKKIINTTYVSRKIDFNQGLDARGIVKYPDRSKLLGELNLSVCRIAFDDLSYEKIYIKAINLCIKFGVKHFSNYLLFNYNDKPIDLYERLKININLYMDNINKVKTLFSFPMKYAPIHQTDREFLGENWSKLEKDSVYAIINVTNGVVAKEKDFFIKAFGKNGNEFNTIIHMPSYMIKNRKIHDENGNIDKFSKLFSQLSNDEVKELELMYYNKVWKSNSANLIELITYFKRGKNETGRY